MSNINRDYLIVLNPKTSKVTVPELNYYIYDKYTANLFVNLVTVENGKVVNLPDADQYKLVLHVLKPTNEIQDVENIQVFNKEKALFQIELDHELTKNIGRYKCELLTIDKTDHVVQSAKFSYRVKKSIYNDLDVVTETPEYPIIIRLLDKLQDIDKYEEERRANEVARVAAEKARVKDYTDLRQTVTTDIETMQEKIDSFDGKVQEVDNAVQQMTTNIDKYQTEKNKELDNYKTQKDTQINTAITDMENTIDTYKTEKDTQINDKFNQQDNKIDKAINLQNINIQASTKALNDKLDAAVQDQNDTIEANNQAQNKVINDAITEQNKTINTVVENDKVQNNRLTTLETSDTNNQAEIKKLQDKDVEHENRMTAIEAVDVEQNNRLDAIEIKNDQQDGRLNDVEAKNKKQDLDLKCLFAESHSERITLDDEVGNSVFLQNSKQGFATVDELKGNTLVNCNKDTDKELILNGNIDTSGYTSVTTTEGVDGGKVDVSLEGNTMVNVCDQEEAVAITKSYTVETGNHIALQGEYDGKCRPNIYGNTLVSWQQSNALKGQQVTINKQYQINGIDSLNTTVGDKVYFRIKFTVDELNTTSPQPKIFTKYNPGYMVDVKQFKDCTVGKIEEASTIREHESAHADQPYMKLCIGMYAKIPEDVPAGSPVCKFTIHDYVIYNLTQLFGAGKEPEQEWCDKNLPYLEGMKSSFEDKLVPENLYKFSSREDFYSLDGGTTLDGEYIKMTANSGYQNAMLKPLSTIKPSTTYTIVVDVVENTLNSKLVITAPVKEKDVQLFTTQTFQIDAGKTGIFTQMATTSNDLSGCVRCLINYLQNTNTTGSVKYRIMVVEGDYTNYDFTDYDSTKGGKYKVDYKVTGKNKCPIENKTITIKGNTTEIGSNDGSVLYKNIDISNLKGQYYFSGKYTINNNTYYTRLLLSKKPLTKSIHNECYLETKNGGGVELGVGIVDLTNYKYATITIGNLITDLTVNTDYQCTLKDIQLEEGTTATTYEPYKESIKTLYLNSPLLEGDTIEQSGNNIIHNHRYGKVVLDGSDDEVWSVSSINNKFPGQYLCYLSYPNVLAVHDNEMSSIMCDKFKVVSPKDTNTSNISPDSISASGIESNLGSSSFRLSISQSKLSSLDLAGFKKYLQQNPITVVYELKTPTQEIISTNNNLLLDSYTNGHLDVDSVVPIDKVWFRDIMIPTKYKYRDTEYIIQFEADNQGILSIYFDDWYNNINIVKGTNKIKLTSASQDTLGIADNYVSFSGIGFNASKIVVTPKVDNDFGYFKGMKSVGECENNKIEILSRNKNLFDSNNITKNKYITGQVGTHQYGDYGDSIYTNVSDYMPVKQGKVYIFSYEYETLFNVGERGYCYYDNNKNIIISKIDTIYDVSKKRTTYTPQQDGYIKIAYDKNCTNIQFEQSDVKTSYSSYAINKKEILLSEPLRGLPNGVKDKYVIIDGKWYIERNTYQTKFNTTNFDIKGIAATTFSNGYQGVYAIVKNIPSVINSTISGYVISDKLSNTLSTYYNGAGNVEGIGTWSDDSADIIGRFKVNTDKPDSTQTRKYIDSLDLNIIYTLATPTYEPIDYNPFEVYKDTTHISNNSNIPCNMVIRNSGFNCILKPNTTYTVSSNNGLSTVVTKDSIGDNVLRFYDKDTSKITKMSNVLVLEGDYITGNPPIPAFFKGMESAFEQELVTDEKDEYYGKYKVNVKAVGKNLLDATKGVMNTGLNSKTICIKVKSNATYVYSSSVYKGTIFIYELPYEVNHGAGIDKVESIALKNHMIADGQSFTTVNSTNYILMNYDGTSNVQLEQGTKATEYEPYKENNITFYINEPLRGVGNVKDKVYVKEDKVVVERNCASVTFDGNTTSTGDVSNYFPSDNSRMFCIEEKDAEKGQNVICDKFRANIDISQPSNRNIEGMFISINGSDSAFYFRILNNKLATQDTNGFKQWLQQNPTTVVYQLATPTYEEVEYFDLKLFVEIFKDTTINYNSNIPVTSTINYTYSTPLTDAVNTVSDISDQQDSMIIDMATQVASMEMMLM